jgi:hypothetical protein
LMGAFADFADVVTDPRANGARSHAAATRTAASARR